MWRRDNDIRNNALGRSTPGISATFCFGVEGGRQGVPRWYILGIVPGKGSNVSGSCGELGLELVMMGSDCMAST